MLFMPGITTFGELYNSQIDNASAKLAFFDALTNINDNDLLHNRSSKILKEILFTRQSGFAFSRNNFLYSLMEEVLQRTIPMGIIRFIVEYTNWFHVRNSVINDESGPSILAFDDLSFGFIIWIVACGVCTCVFLLEIISWLTRKKQKQKVKVRKIKFAKVHPIMVKVHKVKFAKVYPIEIDNLNLDIEVDNESILEIQANTAQSSRKANEADVDALEIISVSLLSV